MSDTERIKDVQDITAALFASEHVPAGAVVIPKDYQLISTEKFEHYANRLRGAFHTELIEDFANYYAANVKADKLSHAPIFVNTRPMVALTALDWLTGDDQPGHKQHRAHCEPVALPDWMALRQAHGTARDQDGMVNFLEDFGGLLTAYDEAGQGMTLSQILTGFRNASITKKS